VWWVRTLAELRIYWTQNEATLTHVVIVGHGSDSSIRFLDDTISGEDLGSELSEATAGGTPKTFISLACKTGHATFAKKFSTTPCCERIVAPFQSVHGAVALQYTQTYFSSLLLAGSKPGRALRNAQLSLPAGNHFTEWKQGEKIAHRY
jgi:hypothetical protein